MLQKCKYKLGLFPSTGLGWINQATQSAILSDVDATNDFNKQEVEVANLKMECSCLSWRFGPGRLATS